MVEDVKLVALDVKTYDELMEKMHILEKLMDSVYLSVPMLADYYETSYHTVMRKRNAWMIPYYGRKKLGKARRKWSLREVFEHLLIPEKERKAEAKRMNMLEKAFKESAQ